MHKFLRAPVVAAAAMAMAIGVTAPTASANNAGPPHKHKDKSVTVHVLAYNDFHGALDPGTQNIYGKFAGGGAYLAKAIKDRQAAYGKLQATVFGGDNIGASPLADGLFFGEPSTILANLMHVDFASVGNHEFDKGKDELLRIQNGGCRPVEGCTAAPYALAGRRGGSTNVYPGADFQYLANNVIVDETGATLFPGYGIKQFQGKHGPKFKVGFIGEVLEGTPSIVTPTGVAGLTFQDEADAANRAVAELAARGVNIPILVVHEGGGQSSPAALNGCNGNLAGSAIADIASRLDPRIKVIISAHTHLEYNCTITINGVTRLITSASSGGRILTDITLQVDPFGGTLMSASAVNTVVENATNTPGPGVVRQADPTKADPRVQAVVDQYLAASAPLANRVIGTIQGDLTRTQSVVNGQTLGEETLGDVIADGQLAATAPADLGGAVVAFMNPGGIRQDLLVNSISPGGEAPGEVTYGEAFSVQPFGNSLVTKTMTGDMIRRLLQQQFAACLANPAPGNRILQVSSSFKYESNPGAATCEGKIGTIWVDGAVVQPTDSFRVTMNNFLATGGDSFSVFNEGTDSLGGAQDIDAWIEYFEAAGAAGIAVPPLDRIVPIP